jgi:hypothetical protein
MYSTCQSACNHQRKPLSTAPVHVPPLQFSDQLSLLSIPIYAYGQKGREGEAGGLTFEVIDKIRNTNRLYLIMDAATGRFTPR